MNRYILPLFLIILSAAIYIFYIDPTYQDITQQLAKQKELEGFIADAKSARERLDVLATEYQAFPADADQKLNVLLPDTIDPAKLIVDVNVVARRHGMVVASPQVTSGKADPNSPKPYITHSLQFTSTATYPTFTEFLRDLEKSLAIRDFRNISFVSTALAESVTAVNPASAVFDYSVEITSYSLH